MSVKDMSSKPMKAGRSFSVALCIFLIAYIIVTLLGFLSLNSPSDPITDPYFTLMELLILIIAPLLTIEMIFIDAYADQDVKIYSRIGLIFMIIMTAITSGVHFVILTFSHQTEIIDLSWMSWFLSFEWPSVSYALDILAWDWFFAISFLSAAQVFKNGKHEKIVRYLMITSGVLSLIGLIGVPLGNMQIRDIGVAGYALVTPFVFYFLSKIFNERID